MATMDDELLAHHIATLKRAAGVGQSVNPYLDRMRAIIRRRVSGFDAERRTAARLQDLIERLADELNVPAKEWIKALKIDLKEFAKYEAAYQAETIGGWVGIELTAPTMTQVWAAAKFEPLALGASPVDFEKLIDDWGAEEVARLTMGVKAGFVQGLTTRQIIKDVVGAGGLSDISQRNALTVANTAMQHIATEARFETYKQNDDVIQGYEWVSTLDSRTSAICRSRDGVVYKFSDRSAPRPPAHYNCLTGDTVVATCSAVSNAYKRAYKGAIVKVTTKSGRTMSVTPNHPVLTSSGWVAAGELNLLSKLVCCNDIGLVIENQKDCVISKFSDLFSSIDVSSDSSLVSNAPASTEDFHGDVSNGEVNVISVNGESWSKVKASFRKDFGDNSLPFRASADFSLFTNCGFMNSLIREGGAPNSVMGGSSKGGYLLGGAPSHSGGLLLTAIPERPKSTFEHCFNWAGAAIKAEVGRDSIDSNPGIVGVNNHSDLSVSKFDSINKANCYPVSPKNAHDWLFSTAEELPDFLASNFVYGVELDDVTDVFLAEFDGHVYNLENENNWYLANGIVTHNCRSSTSPVLSKKYDFLDEGATRAARGADGGQKVAADTTYYDFLKRQPAEFQDQVLGKTKGQIFRNAGLTPEEFRKITVDDLGRPLTIEEMAERDKQVAAYLRKKS